MAHGTEGARGVQNLTLTYINKLNEEKLGWHLAGHQGVRKVER
jgi:hypothetical protein